MFRRRGIFGSSCRSCHGLVRVVVQQPQLHVASCPPGIFGSCFGRERQRPVQQPDVLQLGIVRKSGRIRIGGGGSGGRGCPVNVARRWQQRRWNVSSFVWRFFLQKWARVSRFVIWYVFKFLNCSFVN